MTHTLADFLKQALPWPDPQSQEGWVNLHWRMPNRKGITGGQAFKTLEDILGFIEWSQGKGKGKVTDLYYCTSLQRGHGDVKSNGRYAAERSIDNAVSSRLLFADVDKYASKEEAEAAIRYFCSTSNSPAPSAIVDSGGGLHVYWILPEPLAKDAWLDLAHKLDGLLTQHGLKHDNISTDMARILRPPWTLNYKQGTPRPVVLQHLNGFIDLAAWKSLHAAVPSVSVIKVQKQADFSVSIDHWFVDPAVATQKPSDKFIGLVPIEERIGEGSLDPTTIFSHCPMFRDSLATGGKQVGQPVWHQQALACTFLFGGRELFHDLGRKHIEYTHESSDEMYDRKLRDRANKGLGYPSCAAFEANGAEQCKTCQLRGKVTSPLNINGALLRELGCPTMEESRTTSNQANGHTELFQVPEDSRLELTPPFVYGDPERGENPELIYCVEKVRGKDVRTLMFWSKIIYVEPVREEKRSGIGLRWRCTSGKGHEANIMIRNADFNSPMGVSTRLNEEGCLLAMTNPGKATELALTFRGRMASQREVQRMVPFGWEFEQTKDESQGDPKGFAFGGKIYYPGKQSRSMFGGDEELLKTYKVAGSPTPWYDALRIILGMHSPGLETVVLAGFAAPLMIFTGHPSTVVMVRGPSGGSKSTASAVACAVWACPRTGMIKPSSSKLAMMRRTSKMRHLPVIWDDIRTEHFETVRDTLMEITQGGEGLKLDKNRDEREQGTWDNMLLTSSNASLTEYLEEANKNDGAALARCFEFAVPKIEAGEPAYFDPNEVALTIAELDRHFGHAGREYAQEVLGADPAGLKQLYRTISSDMVKLVAPYQPYERYWMAAASTILMAAHLVNALPTFKANNLQFDTLALDKFLVRTYLELRQRYNDANVHADTSHYVKHYLSLFFNLWAARQVEMVWTSDKPTRVGKPIMTMPVFPIGDAARNLRVVSVRWVIESRQVHISKAALDKFLRLEKVSPDRMRDGLLQFYRAKLNPRGRIAAGLHTVAAQGQEPVYEIEVKPGTWLDAFFQEHSIPDIPSDITSDPSEQGGPAAQ